MIELTEAQQQALDKQVGEPLQVVDPRTRRVYFLVPSDVYAQLATLLDDDKVDMEQVGALIEHTMKEYDEGDPALKSYQKETKDP